MAWVRVPYKLCKRCDQFTEGHSLTGRAFQRFLPLTPNSGWHTRADGLEEPKVMQRTMHSKRFQAGHRNGRSPELFAKTPTSSSRWRGRCGPANAIPCVDLKAISQRGRGHRRV